MKHYLLIVWHFVQSVLFSARVKSLAWSCAAMFVAGVMQVVADKISSLEVSTPAVILMGLVLGQFSKALNNVWQGKRSGLRA